ncbi:membrane protein [Streptomyces hygroscopicus]|uniref:DUF202 domain-containing protein n=1 Tax=Streptomyces hygroscopicus TaxID=1912 RepID=UPI0022408D07|nr:DUF202 domain-containing protein [Streptomyces hygroscopicus]MCW7945163.1 membrane protein [Streptomyces hygroscopicus]
MSGGLARCSGSPDRDPGLQPERTRLAWRRTTLAVTVASVLAVRTALHGRAGSGELPAVACAILAWLGFVVVAHQRIRALSTPRPPLLTHRAALLTAICAALVAACGAALVG